MRDFTVRRFCGSVCLSCGLPVANGQEACGEDCAEDIAACRAILASDNGNDVAPDGGPDYGPGVFTPPAPRAPQGWDYL